MKTLTLIFGVPGSGKSTLANKIALAQGWCSGNITVICEADQFMVDDKGEYKFDPKRLYYCRQKSQEKCKKAMQDGLAVIVSNTSLTNKERKPYLDLATQYGYDVQEIFIRSPFKSVHGVPDWKIEEIKKRLEF